MATAELVDAVKALSLDNPDMGVKKIAAAGMVAAAPNRQGKKRKRMTEKEGDQNALEQMALAKKCRCSPSGCSWQKLVAEIEKRMRIAYQVGEAARQYP